MKNSYKLIISIIIPQLAGALGSVFTASSMDSWYNALEKSPLNPPGWVFGPVWTTLFLLMGIALYLVWTKTSGPSRKLAFGVFGFQLALNILWSVIFFGLQSPGLALAEIWFLWLSILATMCVFLRHSKPAAALLLPYFLWTSFAIYLNYAVWQLN